MNIISVVRARKPYFRTMKFTKEEIDEIKDALEDSLSYYKDILDVKTDESLDSETKKKAIEYARARINTIESIKKKMK